MESVRLISTGRDGGLLKMRRNGRPAIKEGGAI